MAATLQVFGNYPATRGEVEASMKANPNVDPSRPFSLRSPLVPLSDLCEVKGQDGKHQLHGITTAQYNYRWVPAIDLTLGYPQTVGQERHNVFAMNPNAPEPFSTSNLPTKWGKITGIRCVKDLVHYLNGATNVVVIAGAGISTSLGIPDFRSEETGLYAQLQDELTKHGLAEPQMIFDIEQFKSDPSIFYAFANKLMPKFKGVSLTHRFLRALQDQGKLLTVYTQNVDDLEFQTGVIKDKIIQVHGTASKFTCMKCGIESISDIHKMEASKGEVPYCRACPQQAAQARRRKIRKGKKPAKRRRSDYESDEEDSEEGGTNIVRGVMKPNIVFFGEDLKIDYKNRLAQDSPKADLVIVMGTSLKVHPAKDIIDHLPDSALKLWINVEPPPIPEKFDAQLLGSCDIVVGGLAKYMKLAIEDELFQKLEQQEVFIEARGPGVWSFTWVVELDGEDPAEVPWVAPADKEGEDDGGEEEEDGDEEEE